MDLLIGITDAVFLGRLVEGLMSLPFEVIGTKTVGSYDICPVVMS
jgi:hypothetical protein